MIDDLIVSASVEVQASAAKVWDALTDPAIIKDYLYGTETITDWELGSEITFQGVYNGTTYKDKGVILELTPQQSLSYTYWSAFSGLADEPENYSLITCTLVPLADGRTKFTWTQKGYATQESYEQSKTGMDAFMAQIKSVMER